ncbi:MAG: helix-turn-helix domain-containing protein [Pseudomonadota bacterium]
MSQTTLTGSRIRETRLLAGVKQADLARQIGISATYLNLIEHNRRRIGGKLLTDIAGVLEVDPASLAEGAEAEVVAALREADLAMPQVEVELDRIDDFAARFPGWAALVTGQNRRVRDLEQMVENLTDRLAHDPALAASLHDVLTTATAIGSAAAILTETKEIETEWRDRFHRNIHEDSQRLASSSQALVRYLEDPGRPEGQVTSPEEELDAWLAEHDHHIAGLERSLPLTNELLFQEAPGLESAEAQVLGAAVFNRYRQDAAALPLTAFQRAAAEAKYDPVVLSDQFSVPVSQVLRRMATLPRDPGRPRIGLAVCDSAGGLTYRKPLGGFSMPRFGSGCPLWPLYQALSRPMTPIRTVIETAGRDPTRYLTYAMAEPVGVPRFDAPVVYEATMVILPRDLVPFPETDFQVIGTNCRVFPCPSCEARRATA